MDNVTRYKITESSQSSSQAYYHLSFELSEQQSYASEHIVRAIRKGQTILLYAVTGAGKTEMMFQGIQYARIQGDNIAIVSPRVDVVVEISKRIKDAFLNEDIDILHQQSRQQFEGHFVVCTVHQLYRFKQHFDTIFIDEVDAFPLSMDKNLQQALKSSSKVEHATIYMTATPPKQLLSEIPHENIIKLPARFHKKSLPVPKYRYFKLNNKKIQKMLYRILQDQINNQRYTLVFFNNIETMIKTFSVYKQKITKLTYVHSEDVFRFEKVEQLRNGHFDVIFTTTILERGFTMANLDVVVIDAHQYTQEALIQIAGRVGRKLECPTGKVLFFHEGVSMNMIQAKKEIQRMNKLALKRGWIDE
ncbi:DEAD/DEAH box helicase [Staphylococcus aureus]|uniref:DEAD/DEAH box helicase n=1 Tax=Staphylococcus aureus TaxID=1280 RepID=UPI001680A485|nr:DEAD/DEAH box helicase [Staphylococcus aureus]MBD1678408.1 DEAD/DEAH box helicase [Staphylococcus aureus]